MSNIAHPSQIRAYLALSWYSLKAALRNRSTVFFSMVFPLVFITVFGLIGSASQTVKIGLPEGTDQNSLVVASLKQLSIVKTETGSRDLLNQKLKQGKLDAIVVVETIQPRDLRVTLFTSTGNPSSAAAAQSVVRGVVDQSNLRLSNITKPPISIENREVSGRQSRYIDFILPGQIGFSLLSTALFSTVFGFIALRRLLVLKRMFATPVRPITILLSQGTSRLVIALFQTTIILTIGVVVFHFYLPHGWLTFAQLILLSTLGLVSFLGFGLFFSGLANDENSAGPLVNLVTLPQFLLSGVFFPTDLLPSWIQPLANNLPLAYFNQAVRKITTEGGNFTDTIPFMFGFVAWGTLMYLMATKTFKWE